MTAPFGLTDREVALIRNVLARHPEISGALLFGSRAKGTARPASDIDIALEGAIGPLVGASVAEELDELPLPYRFDVVTLTNIDHRPLLEHIQRVGIRIAG
jgi:uncharacterized protein